MAGTRTTADDNTPKEHHSLLLQAIAAINAIANIAGFVGPYLMGYLHDQTGSFEGGLIVLAAIGALAVTLLLTVKPSRQDVWEVRSAELADTAG